MRGRILRKHVLIILIPFAIVVVILALGALMYPSPVKYYLVNPSSPSERRILLERVRAELNSLVAYENASTYPTGVDDPDRLWPVDRLRLVLAIEEYYLRKGVYPKSIQDIEEVGLIRESDLQGRYKLRWSSGGWRLFSEEGAQIAEGN